MFKKTTALFGLVMAAATVPAWAQSEEPPTPQDFVNAVSWSDRYEMEAARIAERRSDSREVRRLARELDRTSAGTGQMLKSTIDNAGVDAVPASGLDESHQAMLDDLRDAQPGAFDEVYLRQQIAEHQNTLDLMHDYVDEGQNAQLKGLARSISERVADRLDMVEGVHPGNG